MKNSLIYIFVAYCFIIILLTREVGILPYDLFIISLIVITWISVIVTARGDDWKAIKNDLVALMSIWFIISLLELLNPGANIIGALSEIKSAALYPFLLVPLGFMIFRENRQLDIFLVLIVSLSTLAAINGIKQLFIHPWPGEQRFLDMGGSVTHILFGKLRVFSFYSEAGQFGASQAAIGVTTLILAFGPFKKKTRIIFFGCALLMLYGMLISGTRGALFALLVGGFTATILFKNIKSIIWGGLLLIGFFCFLKFTYIGNNNYQIYRLRTAVNPEDPSLNTRLATQRALKEYMSTRPFGGGLGVLGFNSRFNMDQFLAKVQPDSYFVKIWAMYGIVGFTIWICIMVYILGKCGGIVWRIEDQALKIKMVALTSGYAGVLFCSYGNEVINNMPSAVVVCLSWVFIFKSPELEKADKSNLIIT